MTKTTAKAADKTATPKAPAKTATKAPAKTPATAKAAPKTDPSSTAPAAKAGKPASRPAATAAQASAPSAESAVSASKVSQNMPTTATKVDSKLANAWKTKSGRELTDAELLAMPDSEYMSDKQQEAFRTRLEALKDDLLSNAGETTEHLREDTSIVPDPADRATIEEEHALELRTRDRERKLLKKISQALTRLESGDYGYCDETGEPIGLGRLLARPTATLSLEAQQRRELKQKMFGD
ncbi:RNA polymerase-binding protein DksA [Aquabacterium soli]|uniref:RNA polymerase-binding transcription factor DksA n=1 Tax=Aquabacterium soli TaxID=2493092 RepID=A0A3R8TBT1_9BURK|nr:RNA polymerase-binding protein DksA [Aquabacterium soli]RRS04177.1 RNA polymerase-binding protein DksA [Aquabacterium soli]